MTWRSNICILFSKNYCCSRFICEVKFLSTSLHQPDLQNFSSPLPLSVSQHLSVLLSRLFYIVVCHSITLHTASKQNHWYNNQNSTALSSKNIVEVMHQEYPRMQVELNSFSSKTITETTTETTTTILKLYVQDSLLRELRELQIPRLIKS